MSLRDKTIAGIGWSSLAQVIQEILGFTIGLILMRLLTPEAYGLVGMIYIFTGFASLFSEAGFGDAIVQRQDIEERHLSSVFWLNLGLGLGLMLVLMAVAPLIAAFYGEPALTTLTMAIALNFFITPFNIVQIALMRRSMDFKVLTLVRSAATLVSGVLALVLAVTGFGVWALVGQLLGGTLVSVAVMWWVSDWRPSFTFELEAIGELWAFSGNLLGFRLVNYWVRKADDLLVGKFAGTAALGVYTRAYQIMLVPVQKLRSVIGKVMFPALSKIQEDKKRLKEVYLRANRPIGLATIPLMCVLFVLAEPLVLAAFGQKWAEVVPILQILCFIGVKQSWSSTVGWLYTALGRTDLKFRWGLVSSAAALIAFGIGIQWGAIGVAAAYAIRGYILWYPSVTIPSRLIDLSFGEFLMNQAGAMGCSLATGAATWGLMVSLPAGWGPWAQIAVLVPTSVALYVGLLQVFGVRAWREALDLAAEQWERVAGD